MNKQRTNALQVFATTKRETPQQRLELSFVLALSDDPQIRSFAEILRDPASEKSSRSVGNLMAEYNISFKRLSSEYQSLMQSEGMMRVFNHIPDLLEDAAIDAKTEVMKCLVCDGEGMVKGKTCKNCRGKGEERVMGSIERLKVILETANLIGKSRGPVVSLNLGNLGGSEEVEDLYGSLSPIIEGNKQ